MMTGDAEAIAQLYRRFLDEPDSVAADWRGLFSDLDEEAEGLLALADRWVFEASAGWLDAGYDEFEAVTRTTGKSASSLGFSMTPEFTASLAATYDLHLPGGGALIWRVSWSYVSELWTDDRNTIEAEEYRLLDASVTFMDEPGRWKLALFGRNLTDEIYFHFGSSGLQHRFFWLTPPRTWGVELTWEL